MRIPANTTITLFTTTMTHTLLPELDNTITSPPWSMTSYFEVPLSTYMTMTVGPTSVLPCQERDLNIVYCDVNRSLIAECTSGFLVATILGLLPAMVPMCQEEWPMNRTRNMSGNETSSGGVGFAGIGGTGRSVASGAGTVYSAVNTTAANFEVHTKIVTSVVRKAK